MTNQIHFPELPSYFSVFVIRQKTSIKVEVHSKIHRNKIVTIPNTWSLDFPPNHLRRDIRDFIIKRYGLTRKPERWS